MELPEKINRLMKQFSRLPGVGEKTALRQTLVMAKWNKETLIEFSQAIKEISELKSCRECGMYCDELLCAVCSDSARKDAKVICVVETITDCLAIERSGTFKGKFHILFGVLNPLMGIGPDELHLEKLFERIQNEKIEEIILAINPSVEGDATCAYIKHQLPNNLNVERIGFGIPIGGSLEFLDPLTISKALENRRHL